MHIVRVKALPLFAILASAMAATAYIGDAPLVQSDSPAATSQKQMITGYPLGYAQLFSPRASGWVDASYLMKCDGETDDTAGLQSAVNSTPTDGTLWLPFGTCLISNTITITRTIQFRGAGGTASTPLASSYSATAAGTTLQWVGASSSAPVLDVRGISGALFEGFIIEVDSPYTLGIGIRSITVTSRYSNSNKYSRVYIRSKTAGPLQKGWVFQTASTDSNNDENTFIDDVVTNFQVAAWSFEHSQSKEHNFFNCRFYGSGAANSYGVTNALGSGGQGGSFKWFGGFGAGAGEADFYLKYANETILISGYSGEGGNRLLETTGSNSAAFPVIIEGTRWALNRLNADGKAIIFTYPGPLVLIGNNIGDTTANPPALQINTNGFAGGTAVAIGNQIATSLSQPFTGTSSWKLQGNNLSQGRSGSSAKLPDIMSFTIGGIATGFPGPVLGDRAFITDQTTVCPGPGVAPTSGGSLSCPVVFNGTAWVGD